MPKNALVVSGGGARGAFAVGAIEVLRERGIRFDLVSGTSTGALIAPLVATDEVQLLRAIYTSVRTEDVVRRRGALEILLRDAIYDSGPLWRLINSFLTPERYAQIVGASADVVLTTVNLQTGRLVYWSPKTSGPGGGPMAREALARAMLASASIPVLMPPVRVREGGDQHVDGGVREVAPLSVAIDRGATDLYALVLSPATADRVEEEFVFIVGTLLRTFNLFTQEVTANDVGRARLYNQAVRYLSQLRAKAAELLPPEEVQALFDAPEAPNPFAEARLLNLHVIRPERPLPAEGLDFDPLVMAQMMARGREAAERALERGPAVA